MWGRSHINGCENALCKRSRGHWRGHCQIQNDFPVNSAPAVTGSTAVTLVGQNFGSNHYSSSQMQYYWQSGWQDLVTTWVSDSSIVAQFSVCTAESMQSSLPCNAFSHEYRTEQIQFVSGPIFVLDKFTYVLCEPGQYFEFAPEPGVGGRCVNCSAGNYSNTTDATMCLSCAAGTYATGYAISSR